MRIKVHLVVFCVFVLTLTGCTGNAQLIDLSEVKTDPNRFVWGSHSDVDVSLGDVGLFYCKDNTLRYYDMEESDEYILCSQANCRHDSKKCSAYFSSDIYGNSADNVAQIGSYIYCTHFGLTMDDYANKIGKSFQLLRIDLSDGTRSVIAEFPCVATIPENADMNSYYAAAIGTVDYCNNWAWFTLDMSQPARTDTSAQSYTQLTGVDLTSGEVVILNTPDGWNYSIQCISANSVYYVKTRNTVSELTEEAFYKQMDEGIVRIDGMEFESYLDYWAYQANDVPDEYEVYVFDVDEKESKRILNGVTTKIGYAQALLSNVYGEYKGRPLIFKLIPNENGEYDGLHVNYYLMDIETGTEELIDTLDDGHALNIAQSAHHPGYIFLDGTFLYARYVDVNSSDIYIYDFNSDEERFLFRDDSGITFRIYGEYKNGYFGKHKDHQYQEGYYWISKEDFFAGNLDAMVHYDAG